MSDNSIAVHGIRLNMKKIVLGLFALLFLAPLVPAAHAQVVVKFGDHHHRHCYYRHHHRHCR